MAKKLNAPRIDTKLPAQKVTQIKIPYRLPNSVGFTDFNNIRILIKNVLSGTKIQEITTLNYRQSNEQYPNYYNAIGILSTEQNEALIEGECYKVQLAFAQDDSIGYYSDAGIIKCVSVPELDFTNEQTGGPSIIYSVAQSAGDQISSYYWKLYQNNQLIEISDIFYGKEETRFYWTPEFNSYKIDANIRIEFCYTTINFYQDYIMQDFIYENSLISNKIERFGIEALYNPSRAAIEVWTIIMNSSLGYYTLYRQDDKTNNWYKIDNCDFSDKSQQVSLLCLDSTVEHGVSYRYAVAQSGQFFEQTTDWIKADLEHIFLSDNEKQLCIKLNPSISAFKNIIQEQKIETIGGQFPYFFRNGNIKYREIPISGLISYWMNEDEGIDQALQNKYEIVNKTYKRGDITRDGYISISDLSELKVIQSGDAQAIYNISVDINQDGKVSVDDMTKILEILSGKIEKDKDNRLATPSNEPYVPNSRTTQLTADNVKKEKDFKLEVEAWLQNGKPKLFRSSTEGNYIIRLMNISLSPNTQLNRMLHTFSATGYEVAEFSPKELRKHKFFYVNKEYSMPDVSDTII